MKKMYNILCIKLLKVWKIVYVEMWNRLTCLEIDFGKKQILVEKKKVHTFGGRVSSIPTFLYLRKRYIDSASIYSTSKGYLKTIN